MTKQTTVQIELKPLNHKQLASMYDVTHKTLKSWLNRFKDELGEMTGGRFTIKQVEIIFENLGLPKRSLQKD
jgi:transposase